MTTRLLCAALSSLALASAARGADDEVRIRLDTAIGKHDKALKDYAEAVDKWFEKEDADARKLTTGVAEKVKLVATEKQEYQKSGTLTRRAPVALRDRPSEAAAALAKAYKAAADDYYRQKKDDLAAAVEKEADAFRKGGRPAGNIPKVAAQPAPGAATPVAKGDGVPPPLAANDVVDGKEWVLPKKGGVSVTKEGHLLLDKPDIELVTKKSDYESVTIRVVLSASKDCEAYIGVGLNGKRPITASIKDEGGKIKAGLQSRDFIAAERGIGKKEFEYGDMFEMRMRAPGTTGEVFIGGKLTSGVSYGKDRDGSLPTGAVGVVVRKGSVTIKTLEVKEIK